MLNIRTVKMIDVSDWDYFVTETYGRIYSFQQQDGCKERGTHTITVPDVCCDYNREEIPEVVNGDVMGVKFEKWLERDPQQLLVNEDGSQNPSESSRNLWWERNFYPDVQAVANDLHAKGLLEAGSYVIDIDW